MLGTQRRKIQRVVRTLVLLAFTCLFAARASAGQPKRPELILPLGHSNSVVAGALSEDGKRALTSGSRDKTAILWDVATGKPIQIFKGDPEWFGSVAFSRDGSRVLAAASQWSGKGSDEARSAILFDVRTGQRLRSFRDQGHTVGGIALSDDGKRVVTGSWEKVARLWDADTGRPLQNFVGHAKEVLAVAISGDGARVLTGSWDQSAILWDAATAQALKTFQQHAKASGTKYFTRFRPSSAQS